MATQYTSLLGLALPVTGELSGSWGDTVNDAITSLLDSAVAGTTSITADADITLTTTTGVANQSRQAVILWNPATGTATRTITAPAQSKIYTVINASGGTQSIVFKAVGQTGVTIVKGESAIIAFNGTDFIKIGNVGGGSFFTDLTVSGTTTLSGLTASTALALNASKEVVSVTNTGTGNNVLATSPTLVTPALGTPSALTLTNATGLPVATGISGLGSGVATFLATPSSSNLAAAVSDETGSGALVFASSPTLVTPSLGTPSVLTLTNATGLPLTTGVTGILPVANGGTGIATLGAGVATFLSTPSSANLAAAVTDETGSGSLVFANSPTLVTPALGTPSALVGTNITGTAAGLTAGNVTTNANLTGAVTSVGNATSLGSFSSANLAAAVTDETGTGALVFATSPTLVTPALGTPASGVVTNLTGTASININGTVGATTANTGAFTTLSASGNVTLSTLTSGRVPYASTGGLLVDSANLLYAGADLTVYGLTVGRGAGAVAGNTVVGQNALANNVTGTDLTAVGQNAYRYGTGVNNTAFGSNAMGNGVVTGSENTAIGRASLFANTSGANNIALGTQALFANTTGTNNTAIGTLALVSNTTASNNTAVGYQAAYSNTTGALTAIGYQAGYSNTTAQGHVFVGYQAGFANTGSDNTFVGVLAGTANTTGSNNVAFGRSALAANTTASNNVAVGFKALELNTTGANNSGLGFATLNANTTGASNVAVGHEALNRNTTASSNTAVGYQAAYSNTTGTSIDAFGTGALYANTTGTNNAGFAAGSLVSNTTGSSNSAFGRDALRSNTTASRNTAVGYQAGYSDTTGFANLFVGYNSGRLLTTGTGNTMVGDSSGAVATTGNFNTFVGQASGSEITTGAKNTIIGTYNGNQGGLDIRTATGYVVLSDGDGRPLLSTVTTASVALEGATPTTGTGITFPATQNAAPNANTLDDYEEGSWTPTLSGTSGSITVSSTALYTKIGNLVTITAGIGWSSSTLAGQITIGGFPFAVNSAAGYRSAATFGYVAGISFTGQIATDISAGTQGLIIDLQSGTVPTNIALSATGDLQFTYTYQV